MPDEVTKYLELRFLNEAGGKVTIRVNDPKEGLTAEEVKTAMETIIDKNVFSSRGGDLAAIDSARIISRETVELAINQ